MSRLFDTHAHLIAADPQLYPPSCLRGQSDLPAMPSAITVEMLLEDMDANAVQWACLVQRAHVYGYDNSYVVDSALACSERLISVGVFDAQDPATPDIVAELATGRGLRGVRICSVRPWEMDTGWLNSPQAMKFWETAAAHSLPVAVIFFHYHLAWGLPALREIARLFPDLPIIVDHVGCRHASGPEVRWGEDQGFDMRAPGPPDYGLPEALGPFLDRRSVAFKMTKINVDRLRDAGLQLSGFVRRLVDLVGADRLMWGSDIGQSPGTYAEMTAAAREAGAELNDVERERFFSGTARRIYRMED